MKNKETPQPVTTERLKASLRGEIRLPGDKSISHRALIISSMCIGQSKIKGLLESDDVFATMQTLKKLGVRIEKSNGEFYFYAFKIRNNTQ